MQKKQYRQHPLDAKSVAPGCAYFLYVLWGGKTSRAESSECQKMMPEQPEGYRLLGEFYLATAILQRRLPNTLRCIKSIPKISLFENDT